MIHFLLNRMSYHNVAKLHMYMDSVYWTKNWFDTIFFYEI